MSEALVPCPLCGAQDGYSLAEGDTYRWWEVWCAVCGNSVAECTSDRKITAGSALPGQWPAADRAWNRAGKYAYTLRIRAEAAEAELARLNAVIHPCKA